jgi:hypothetical protein
MGVTLRRKYSRNTRRAHHLELKTKFDHDIYLWHVVLVYFTALIVISLTAEFKKLSPLQLIPVLEIDGETLVDSIAIIQVLPATLENTTGRVAPLVLSMRPCKNISRIQD